MTESEINTALEASFEQAIGGDEPAAKTFFRELLRGPLFVPERYQSQPLTDAPNYPNDFVNILGVRAGERVFVPVFTRLANIEQWCGNTLKSKTLSGTELTALVPEGWWVTLNPGAEIEKELSPWELDQLRGGEANVDALAHELFADIEVEALEVEPLKSADLPELKKRLLEYAASNKEITTVYLLRERGIDANEKPTSTILLGVAIDRSDQERFNTLREEVRAVAELCLIGADPLKTYVGASNDSLSLQQFEGTEPLFQRSSGSHPSLLSRVTKLFRRQT